MKIGIVNNGKANTNGAPVPYCGFMFKIRLALPDKPWLNNEMIRVDIIKNPQ